jgi:hypothetical protein
MADNDILYDKAYQLELKDYMISQGYEAVSVGKGNHDVYTKEPIYNFELHTSLFGTLHNPIWTQYYTNTKDRLVRDGEKTCGYHFTDEDFYIYLLVHAYKHYAGGGTGLRTLLDVYVYQWKKGQKLDYEYIRQEVMKLEIDTFEQMSRTLSYKLFDTPLDDYESLLSEEETEQLSYFIGSGTYGTSTNRIHHNLEKLQDDGGKISVKTKILYLFGRIFPGVEWMSVYYPICARHHWLILVLWPYRIVKGIILRGKSIISEFETVRRTN